MAHAIRPVRMPERSCATNVEGRISVSQPRQGSRFFLPLKGSRMSKYFVAAIGISALLTGQVLAQGQPANQNPRGRAPQNANQASQGNAQQLDQHAAACLLIGNQEEIAM